MRACVLRLCLLLGAVGAAVLSGPAVAQSDGNPEPELNGEPVETTGAWPRVFRKDGATIVLHQPQIDRWDDFSTMLFRSGLQVTDAEGTEHFGYIEVTARTQIDKLERRVRLTEPRVDILFPDVPMPVGVELVALVRDLMPGRSSLEVDLDRVLAQMDESILAERAVEVNLDPPNILYSASPAELMVFLGSPRLQNIEGTSLQFAVNTNWDVIYEPGSRAYYVLQGDAWVSATNVLDGPFTPVENLPEEFSLIPDSPSWSDVRAAVPARPAGAAPTLIASAEPSEIIVTNGPPSYAPIPGTSLQQVVNTDVPLIYEPATTTYYFLTAGRWFATKDLAGGWTAATFSLPDDFRAIPPDGELGDLRASIAGTDEAEAAAVLAAIPQTATVRRDEVTVEVAYEGEPKLAPIESTDVQYVVNTASDVFVVDNRYYCCHQGIWFDSDASNGPWQVSDTVPAEIYAIPTSSPKHNVTYVTVYESTPETVTVGSSSGYAGELIVGGLVVFGAALLIDEMLDDHDDYWYSCHWHAGFYSYGCGAVYHHGHGGYYRAATRCGPYGGARGGAIYNPRTGGWARGAARYGPRGAAAVREGYNPWTDTYAARAGAATPYGSWSRGVAVRDDDWVRGGQARTVRGSAGWAESSEGGAIAHVDRRRGGQGTVARDDEGNVYVGKDGNVYRRSDDGQWESRQDGDWQPSERAASAQAARDERAESGQRTRGEPAGQRRDGSERQGRGATTQRDVTADLDRQARARSAGNRRAQSVQRERSRPTRGGARGGARGGGRRR